MEPAWLDYVDGMDVYGGTRAGCSEGWVIVVTGCGLTWILLDLEWLVAGLADCLTEYEFPILIA